MTKNSLIVLSACLLIGAGIAGTVWAYCCCTNSCLCNDGVVQIVDTCWFKFDVDHDKDCGTGHNVYLYLKENGALDFTAFMMTPGGPPYPSCILYTTSLELDANTGYWYYFVCPTCGQATVTGYFNTGECD